MIEPGKNVSAIVPYDDGVKLIMKDDSYVAVSNELIMDLAAYTAGLIYKEYDNDTVVTKLVDIRDRHIEYDFSLVYHYQGGYRELLKCRSCVSNTAFVLNLIKLKLYDMKVEKVDVGNGCVTCVIEDLPYVYRNHNKRGDVIEL